MTDSDNPGPGQYEKPPERYESEKSFRRNASTDKILKSNASRIFNTQGSKTRLHSHESLVHSASDISLPGPGAYDPAFGSIKERVAAMSKRLTRNNSCQSIKQSQPPTPGPGEYIKSDKILSLLSRRLTNVKFTKSRRWSRVHELLNAPVYYVKNLERVDSTKRSTRKLAIPREIRWNYKQAQA